MTQEQQHLFMTIHSKLVSLKYNGEVTEQLVIRDIANDAIDDLIKLRDLLASEKEGDLSDDEKQAYYHQKDMIRLINEQNENE